MEEALMDYNMLRRLVLEQRLVDYVYANEPDKTPHYFECGPEFGVAHLWFKGGWRIEWEPHRMEWVAIGCPVDLDDLPKEEE